MSLVRWDPFSDTQSLFDRTMPRLLASLPRLVLGGDGSEAIEWLPSADISETDHEYLIRAELPAVRKEDVRVTVENGMLTIHGQRRAQKEDRSEKYHRVESLYGTFTRRFTLPDNVHVANIRCEDRDGVLTVHIPKMQTDKQKAVEIKVQ